MGPGIPLGQRRVQEMLKTLCHTLPGLVVGVDGQPDIVAIAPYPIGQSQGHRWRAGLSPIAQTPMGYDPVVEAGHPPDASLMAGSTPHK